MITIAEYLDSVAAERMSPRMLLSPEGMLHAERFFREFGEQLAEQAIQFAMHKLKAEGQTWWDAPYASKSRQQRLERTLTDTKPLIEPPPDKPSSSK